MIVLNSQTPPRNPVRIMLVDDHAVVRKGVRMIVEANSRWLICAETADSREAIDIARKQLPNIVIMDIMMPALNGVDATERLRKAVPQAEVLVFTMNESEDTMGRALRAGARGYVLKSECEGQLVAAIQALAEGRSYFSPRISEALLRVYLEKPPRNEEFLLTPREREIVQLVAEGQSNKRIASRLDVSVKTVESHRSAAMRKIGAKSSADVVLYAVRNNLVQI